MNDQHQNLQIFESSKYFTALETPDGGDLIAPTNPYDDDHFDSSIFLTKKSNFDHDVNNNSSNLSSVNTDNYYSSLIRSQMNSIDHYSSLYIPSSSLSSENTNTNSNSNSDYYLQTNDMRQFVSCNISNKLIDSIRELENDCIQTLTRTIQDKRIKNFSLDQTIDQVVDETDYEMKLEELIRHYVHKTSLILDDSSTSKHQLNRSAHIELTSSDELALLEHVFNLIKYSSINEMFRKFKKMFNRFLDKLYELETNPSLASSHKSKIIAKIFTSLFKLDFNGMIEAFSRISSSNEKWNLVRNILYYVLKVILFHIAIEIIWNDYEGDDNDNDNDDGNDVNSSFCLILNVMYNYVKHFGACFYTNKP